MPRIRIVALLEVAESGSELRMCVCFSGKQLPTLLRTKRSAQQTGLGPEPVEGFGQSVFSVDLRLPAQQFPSASDIRAATLRIILNGGDVMHRRGAMSL